MMTWASGWEVEDGQWVYLDKYGDRVTEEWKRSGDYYYYLDEDGFMATNRLVEDEDNVYYVNEQGIRVLNQWVSVDNTDGDEVDGKKVDTLWYYFGSSGKAYRAADSELKAKTIGSDTYIFDQEGRMVSGWTELGEDTYYLGTENEGWAKKGWQHLEPSDDMSQEEYDDQEWFHFKDSGKMRFDCSAYIDGRYYRFNQDGVMEDEWHNPSGTSEAFAGTDGSVTNGWVYTSEPGDANGDFYWYYLVNVKDQEGKTVRGVPFNYESGVGYQAKSINGKIYLFDEEGKMQEGIVDLDTDLDAEIAGAKALEAGIYYFEEKDGSTNGQMRTGKVTVEEEGEKYYYHFTNSGKAYVNTVKNGYLYDEFGQKVYADDGNSYMVYETRHEIDVDGSSKVIPANTQILVSASGKVKTSGRTKIDGDTWKVVNTDTYAVELQPED